MRQRYGRDVAETWHNKSGSFPVNKCGDERSTFNCNNTINDRLIILLFWRLYALALKT